MSWGARLVVLAPYAWLLALFLVPFLIVLKISLSQTVIAQPPYAPVLAAWDVASIRAFLARLSADSYLTLASDSLYAASYLRSLQVAAVATAILLVIGYPIAWAMARASARSQAVLVVLVVLPFWTSFLIRVYAWVAILQHDGLVNRALVALDIVDAPVAWLASDTAVYLGLVYSYLPFMVLPLYASLQKMDESLLEAAADLGCPPWRAFWSVTVPLSLPGAAAGALLCFIPITGEFVVPDLLGGSEAMMIGQTLWSEFFANRDWPVAAAIAVVMLGLLLGPIALYEHLQARALGKDA